LDEQDAMKAKLPPSWMAQVGEEFAKPYFHKLRDFLRAERERYTVFPPENEVFFALETTLYPDVNVLILGQDPYHDEGQAHGMAFSVRPGVRPPPSLQNIFRELHNDLGLPTPNNGYLVPWAEQGVLLLNAVLTVRAHAPNSHRGKGWEKFTDAVFRKVNEKKDRVVFVLWGGNARKKRELIDTSRHLIIESAHPSPLSARHGFFGSKPFSAINRALRMAGKKEIDWQLPDWPTKNSRLKRRVASRAT
jgi:uracil-DNA glycosylase